MADKLIPFNHIIHCVTGKGLHVVYVPALKGDKDKMNFFIQHRLRRRSLLYGVIVTTYNKNMDFSYSIAKGGVILSDKR